MTEYTKAHSIVGFNPEGRPKHDFYPTPRRGTEGLLEREKFLSAVWEPACGDGSMSNVIKEFGYTVIETDLEPRGCGTTLDFLSADSLLAPDIITNPPFRYAQDFMEKALDLGCRKLALLCKIQFLEGIKRTESLMKTPLQTVYVFRKRLKLCRNGEIIKGGGMMTFAWFVWYKHYKGNAEIRWI